MRSSCPILAGARQAHVHPAHHRDDFLMKWQVLHNFVEKRGDNAAVDDSGPALVLHFRKKRGTYPIALVLELQGEPGRISLSAAEAVRVRSEGS